MRVSGEFRPLGVVALTCTGLGLVAQTPTIPPSVTRVTPPGIRRGANSVLTVQGSNLEGIRALLFDAPDVVAKVLSVEDLPEEKEKQSASGERAVTAGKKQEAKLEITASPDVELGVHKFRVETSRGTSNLAALEVGALPEVSEAEPNDSPVGGQQLELPATVTGCIDPAGDVDTFQFNARAGQELVFEVVASNLGSQLRSLLVVRDAAGKELARTGDVSSRPDALLVFKPLATGEYTISLSDLAKRGGKDFFYRLNAGAFPYLTEAFPLGLREAGWSEVEVKGANLGNVRKVRVQAPPAGAGWQPIPIRVKTTQGESLNRLYLAVGKEPEITEREPNDSPSEAQPISIPITINGHIRGHSIPGMSDEDYFRFSAKAGQRLTVEVEAARLGSPLDSVVEVLDAQGHQIPRATIRCLHETILSYPDMDSKEPAFSLVSIEGLRPYDTVMIGHELLQLIFVPDQADVRALVRNYGGERISALNTSPDAYLSRESQTDTPVYKVKILDPGADLAPNGLPIVRLTYRNDDGGPGYGADSRLDFVAQRDGDYLVHLKDVRGFQGEDYAYRLSIREASPDFRLTAQPANPNVPRGGRVPVTVEADRRLGYEGPIDILAKGLPAGVAAQPVTIPAGQDSILLILEAAQQASGAESRAAFEIVGRANLKGHELIRVADAGQPLGTVSVIPPPDVELGIEPREVSLRAGERTGVTLRVNRKNGFVGSVPCRIANLPPGVSVADMGLNGVVVPENETTRGVTLRAEDWAGSIDQAIYVVGMVASSPPTPQVSAPATLRLRAKQDKPTEGH